MKIFVALPIFNFITPKAKDNHTVLFAKTNHKIVFTQVVGIGVPLARKIMIDKFLETDCDYYFTMDSDIFHLGDFDPFDKLISLNKDIIGGLYVYRKKPYLPVFRPLDLQEIYESTGKFPEDYKFNIPNEPFEVKWLGDGFKLVKREVVKRIREKILIPNLPMIYKDEYVSDDWAFDMRARELGYSVWIDPSIKLGHEGNFIFTIENYLKGV